MVKQYASAGVRILLQRLGLLCLKILDVSNYFEAFQKVQLKSCTQTDKAQTGRKVHYMVPLLFPTFNSQDWPWEAF